MNKFLSTHYNNTSFNVALFLLRVGLGVIAFNHGYQKLIHFEGLKNTYYNFFGIGSTSSLVLATGTELVGPLLLILGLFTRVAALLLVMLISFLIFKVSNGDVLGKAEHLMPLLFGYLTILFIGGGKYSVEGAIGK